ncbi:restriction endonuclease fold toxin 5 domain-containing protein [Providencia alcalifaciens]|uniref:Tox-REase-5 domain-containing protein n=1 Tax=Providencia alcalifaciens TaxID=126385 RepID=UPI001CE22CF7|nr:Tox-REase-5 domain-containing protein [Providencia alcalifaciens]UBX50029.1 restriction endonuclease fold toxin 5 domain-containing protein [Providencia alcalifaciens]
MPFPLVILAAAGLATLGGLAAVTQEASKIGFPSSSGSSDDEWGNESIAIGGTDIEDENGRRGRGQSSATGAVAGSSIGVAAIEASKGCKKCTAIGLVGPHKQPTNGWSLESIIYQQRICSTTIGVDGTYGYINEYECMEVHFDGWRETQCLFLEAKGKYDSFFNSDGEPYFNGFQGIAGVMSQAARHQFVMDSLQNIPFCHWHFMQPKSAGYFAREFAGFSNLKVFHTP